MMNMQRYNVGDTVVLKSGALRSRQTEIQCRIDSVLPDAYGLAQYRVRLEGEGCDRRITQEDIRHEASSASREQASAPALAGGSWVNSNTIKIKR
jgi:hypothetical protein